MTSVFCRSQGECLSSGPGEVTSSDPWLLVFDLDGTLIDSSRDLCSAVNAALQHTGHPLLPPETISGFIGNGAEALVRRALQHSSGVEGTPDQAQFKEAYSHFLQFYRTHKLDNTRPYAGVVEALQAIRDRRPDLLMAVLTNKPVRPSREICAGLGLSKFFFANYGGDSFPTKKPSPEGLRTIISEARQMRLPEDRDGDEFAANGIVMIGDSEPDVLVARNCGVRSLGCNYGISPELLLAAGPDLVVDHASQWPEALGLLPEPAAAASSALVRGQSQAAPRTPLESPCIFRRMGVFVPRPKA